MKDKPKVLSLAMERFHYLLFENDICDFLCVCVKSQKSYQNYEPPQSYELHYPADSCRGPLTNAGTSNSLEKGRGQWKKPCAALTAMTQTYRRMDPLLWRGGWKGIMLPSPNLLSQIFGETRPRNPRSSRL